MNINTVASALQNLSDDQLHAEMLHPQTGIPQFLIMSEVQRRQKMRAGAQNGQGVNTQPVMDEMRQGIAGMPQMSQGAAPPTQGGIPSFAGGGSVDDEDIQYDPVTGMPVNGSIHGAGADSIGTQVTNAIGRIGNPDYKPFVPKAASVPAQKTAPPPPPKPAALAPSPFTPAASGAPSDRMILLQDQRGDALADGRTGDVLALDNAIAQEQANPTQAAAGGRGKSSVKTSSKSSGGIKSARSARSSGGGAYADVGGAGGPGVAGIAGTSYAPPAPDSYPKYADQVQLMDVPDMPAQVQAPQIRSPEEYTDMVNKANPDMLSPLLQRADQRLAENKGRRRDALNEGLMAAGLGMMAGKSQYALSNIGEGGLQGLKAYSAGMQDMRNREDSLNQHRDAVVMAQQQAAAGNFKEAAAIANNENARNESMYGHQIADRRIDVQDRAAIMKGNTSEKNAAMMADTKTQIEAMNEGNNYNRDINKMNFQQKLSMQQINAQADRAASLAASTASRQEAHDNRVMNRNDAKGHENERKDRVKEAQKQYSMLQQNYLSSAKGQLLMNQDPAAGAQAAHNFAMDTISPEHRVLIDPHYTKKEKKAGLRMDMSGQIQ